MKALRAEGKWEPRKGYHPTEQELQGKWAFVGSQVWRNPVIRISDLPDPVPGNGELLIKIRYCGICGSDTHVYETDDQGYIIFSGQTKLPVTLGHEYCGEVIEVGKGVRNFTVGDIVTGESVLWCGRCLPCRQGMLNQCEKVELMGLSVDGAFAGYIAMDEKYCWLLNSLESRFDKEEVLRIGCLVEPLGCAYNGMFISGDHFYPGSYAVVYGVGPIGLGAVNLLKTSGAAKIIAVDVIDERLDIAKRMGADYIINIDRTDNFEEAIGEITSGWGADLQVEAAGAARVTLPVMQSLCSSRGKIIYLGRAESLADIEMNSIVSGAHSIIGSRGHCGYGIFPNLIRLLEGGKLDDIREMITSVFPLEEGGAAFEASRKRTDGKILIEM